jgi:hypothetical protein
MPIAPLYTILHLHKLTVTQLRLWSLLCYGICEIDRRVVISAFLVFLAAHTAIQQSLHFCLIEICQGGSCCPVRSLPLDL